MKFVPRLVAWELTNRCNLKCRHCRAADAGDKDPNELSPEEAQTLIEQIAEYAPLTLILSGGEPTVREDFMDIVRSGVKHKLRVAVATNGHCLDDEMAQTLKDEGVSRLSMSLDGADAETHDGLRGLEGAYDRLIESAERLKRVGLPFQINTTVTKNNVDQLPKIVELVPTLGAVEHHVFMFVPTGRGETMADESLGAESYEKTLRWLAEAQKDAPLHIQVTCGPHYQRILRQEGHLDPSKEAPKRRAGNGCMAGTGFAFISARGEVMPCGYLPIPAGDVRIQTFGEIWRSSSLFNDLRDRSLLQGRCGVCEYRKVCGGCRARAYALTGEVTGEEPYCAHEPSRLKKA